ncbi:uncharacterized protein [Temnothorax nylanderi]|uniref:uncharacterized protein n=1 Tax=Temnothorax nylanderi TaxID=102681 RepID=UPI003A89C469
MSVIIKCGFQSVKLNLFRKKSVSKGKKLFYSNHVGHISEEILQFKRILRGTVLRETPGGFSTKNNTNFYKPVIELNNDREILNCSCTCKAGKGYCKHAAAVCIFVNEENFRSKTDEPMLWNRPPEEQLQKYKKTCTIDSLFPSMEGNIVHKQNYSFEDIVAVTQNEFHMSQNFEMIFAVKAELSCEIEKGKNSLVVMEQEKQSKDLIGQLFKVQTKKQFKLYHAYEILENNICLKMRVIKCPAKHEKFYAEEVTLDEVQWKDICFLSFNQSDTVIWYRKRYIRVTASSRAHRIKTRTDNFDKLALTFKNEKYQGYQSEAMRYGMQMEATARQWFQEKTNFIVHQTGLIISIDQPFLGYSPDGIIRNENNYELLEIKCPFTCRNAKIVDYDKEITYVPYLFFNNKKAIELKKTQILFI